MISDNRKYSNSAVIKTIKDVINANQFNYNKSKTTPIALNIEGTHGIGKTSVVKQAAAELNAHFYLDSLAQNTDPGELMGFPISQIKVCREGLEMWIPASSISHYLAAGAEICTEDAYRTSYAKPFKIKDMWEKYNSYLKQLENFENNLISEKPEEPLFIYVIDDAFRANPLIMQAVMDLIESQSCGAWSLPPNTHIILTNNPDDGNYNVSGQDGAQASRYVTIKMEWNHEDWAVYAEDKVDGRSINFVLQNHTCFTPELNEDNSIPENHVSPRMLDKFFNLISNIDDFNTEENKSQVRMFGNLTVGKIITNEYIRFISEGYDKLPSPEELLLKYTEEEFLDKFLSLVGSYTDNASYNKATASILVIRMKNYIIKNYKDLKTSQKNMIHNKMLNMFDSGSVSNDLTVILAKAFSENQSTRNLSIFISKSKLYVKSLINI
jgi:MoxR-like ATPase